MQLYGVEDGTPYGEWPTDALLRLYGDLGRNGTLSEDQERIEHEVKELLEEEVSTLRKCPQKRGRYYKARHTLSRFYFTQKPSIRMEGF